MLTVHGDGWVHASDSYYIGCSVKLLLRLVEVTRSPLQHVKLVDSLFCGEWRNVCLLVKAVSLSQVETRDGIISHMAHMKIRIKMEKDNGISH